MSEHLLKENRLKQTEIDEACIAVMQRGERISTSIIYKELGERGSFSTIQKMVKDWQARNPEQSERVENLPLKADIPETLKSAGENALKAFWNTAREVAHNELEVQRESLKKAEEDINLKIEELQEFSDNQTNTIEVLREQLGNVTAENTKLQIERENTNTTLASLTEQLQQARHDLELSNIENQAMTERITEAKVLHEEQVNELKVTIAEREAENTKIRADFETRSKTQEETAKGLNTQITRLQTTLDAQVEKVDEAKAERTEALTAEKQALEKAAALTGKLELVLAENKELKTKPKPEVEEPKQEPMLTETAETTKPAKTPTPRKTTTPKTATKTPPK
jgi:chromosome segregation ATPase